MPKSIGTDKNVLVREAYRAVFATCGCSGGVWPSLTQVMSFCWAGQIMNHTLNHIIMPKSAPMEIHSPALEPKSPASPVKPLPKRKYFHSSSSRPDRNVNIAPQRNHHNVRGSNCGITSRLVAGCSAAVTCALMRLKKYN